MNMNNCQQYFLNIVFSKILILGLGLGMWNSHILFVGLQNGVTSIGGMAIFSKIKGPFIFDSESYF